MKKRILVVIALILLVQYKVMSTSFYSTIINGLTFDTHKSSEFPHYAPSSNIVYLVNAEFGLTDATIPEYVYISSNKYTTVYITSNAFDKCTTLRSVSTPKYVKYLEKNTFANHPSLQSVDMKGLNIEIGDYCFVNCPYLSTVTTNKSPFSVGEGAFANCPKLKSINIEGCHSIEDGAFKGCSSIETIFISSLGSKEIKSGVFSGCSSLRTVTLPDNITAIRSYAFANCTSLQEFIIPQQTTKIENNAFEGCTSLTKIEIPYNVTYVGSNAFKNCINLESVILGENLTKLLGGSFSGCLKLNAIYNYRDLPAILNTDPFTYVDKMKCVLYVPASSIDLYKEAAYWKDFYHIRAIGDEISIYTVTFYDYDNTILSQQEVYDGDSATEPAQPKRDGYSFVGWSKNFNKITSNLDIIAQYKPVTIGVEEVTADNKYKKNTKIKENGQIYIVLPDGTKYNTLGVKQ